jgi:hypothetical protein
VLCKDRNDDGCCPFYRFSLLKLLFG